MTVHEDRPGRLGELATRIHTPGSTPGADAVLIHGARTVLAGDVVTLGDPAALLATRAMSPPTIPAPLSHPPAGSAVRRPRST